MLWALALASAGEAARAELMSLLAKPAAEETTLARARELYEQSGAFQQAAALVAKHHRRTAEAADAIPNPCLRRLLHFLADAILDRRPLSINEDGR